MNDHGHAMHSSANLTLIGTVHRDRRGGEKLFQLLRSLRPDILTLEMSGKALSYRLGEASNQLTRLDHILNRIAADGGRDREELERHPAVADIRLLLQIPFEFRVASTFAEETGIPLHLIDRSDISAAKLRKVETELITHSNLKVLANLPFDEEPRRGENYGMARQLIRDGADQGLRRAFLEGRRGVEEIGPRDRHMAGKIRLLLERYPGKHLVHIGGWVHLIEDNREETLFSLLADLQPQRVLLKQEP